MTKFFTIDRIKSAIEHLSDFNSKWVIPPLVFACNGVDSGSGYRDLNAGVGTDAFLDKFFSGEIIGLSKERGPGTIRPKFKELATKRDALKDSTGTVVPGTDYILHQKTKLWANAYSRTGYSEMMQRRELEKLTGTMSSFRLTATFQPAFQAGLPAAFQFEQLLVWLFAFKEIPDSVNSWPELWDYFRQIFLNGADIPAEYKDRFKLSSPPIPWPTDYLTMRPANIDYQRALLPSSFVEPLNLETWKLIRDELQSAITAEYEGLTTRDIEQLSRSIVSGLAGTRRVFLLGDPGTGKSTLTKQVKLAFEKVIDDSRLLFIAAEVTDKTTESTLIGFTGLDGAWIPGVLTAPNHDGCLLNTEVDIAKPEVRNQINLIILDETNRKDIESLLARLQTALDGTAKDPRDNAYSIGLGKDGVRWISPSTFFLMTGNSPKNDEGRVEQSRPFKRRPALVHIPNPLGRWIQTANDQDFIEEAKKIWKRAAVDSQADAMASAIEASIGVETETMSLLRSVFVVMDKFKLGVSYGLLKKILTLVANEIALGATNFSDAVDAALATGVSALLSSRTAVNGRSLKEELLALVTLEVQFPRFAAFVKNELGDVSEYGTITPHF